MLEKELAVFDLQEFMNKITFVSDRGSNFVSALRKFDVLYCVAHRLNNILKRTFFQGLKKKKKNITPIKSFTFSTNITAKEVTPTKVGRTTTMTTVLSPDIFCEAIDDDNGDSEESSDEEDDDDPLDYTVATIADLNPATKQVLETINHCKSLVKYAKKVWNFYYIM